MSNHKDSNFFTIESLDLPATTPLVDIFAHYNEQPWAMFLDSADTQREDGRFDIIVADPIATLSTIGSSSSLWQKNSGVTESSTDNPLTLLQNLLKHYLPQVNKTELTHTKIPFIAGAMGSLGYDLGKRFETLPDKNSDQYHTPDMAMGIFTWSIIRDNDSKQTYLCFINQYPHPSAEEIVHLASKPSESRDFALTSCWQANMSQQEYETKLQRIHSYLLAGDCYQINLAQRFTATYEGHEWPAYQQLRKANHAPFSAFIRLPNSVIMSISPERFLLVDNEQQVQTKPIKGTRPRHENSSVDQQQIDSLRHAEKDRAENLMIVDLLRNDLSKHCQPGTVEVPELFKIESFAAVHHLVSTVTGQLNSASNALDLLQGAFPGGSITGAPKIRAMEIIDELEPNKRNIYCGSIGYIGLLGDMDTNICIRTLLCEESNGQPTIHCWAGGGIVLDSDAGEEYQESLDKVAKILPILNPHNAPISVG